MPRPKTPILDDLVRFASIGDLLKQEPPLSLNRIAKALGISYPAVQDCIRRVEEHIGGHKLVHTSAKVGASTSLTSTGERYLEQIQQLVKWKPVSSIQLRLAIPPTLLTSQLLTPALAAIGLPRGPHDIYLRTGDVVTNFEQTVRALQTDRLDLAFVWETGDRADTQYPGVDQAQLGFPFEVVFVGRKPQDVQIDVENLAPLARRRVIAMQPDDRPLPIRLPPAEGSGGGERITVETFDAVLAHVLASANSIGIVVANYDVLEPLQISGLIYFSKPIAYINLMWLSVKNARKSIVEFRSAVDTYLKDLPNQPVRYQAMNDTLFPDDPRFYERFKYAYYVDHYRIGTEIKSADPPRWHWERLYLTHTGRRINSGHSFNGKIRNVFGDRFTFTAQLVGNNMFYAQASHGTYPVPLLSVPEFVSVFDWCSREPNKGIMYGHWSTTEPLDHHPALFSTIWSWERLNVAELRRLAKHMRARTVLDIDTGVHFDKQLEDLDGFPDLHDLSD